MSKRSYGQSCALALGLDIIGERWTLLIIRGLLAGPKRYSELLDQLQGMGTNLLAARLKALKNHQIVEQISSADDGVARYSLTGRGEQLRPIIHSLIRWGHQFRGLAAIDAISCPEWDMLAIEAAFRPERANGLACILDLTLGDFRFHIIVKDQSARCVTGAAGNPDAIVSTTSSVLMKIGEGELEINKAISSGVLELSGSRRAFRLLFKLFEL